MGNGSIYLIVPWCAIFRKITIFNIILRNLEVLHYTFLILNVIYCIQIACNRKVNEKKKECVTQHIQFILIKYFNYKVNLP